MHLFRILLLPALAHAFILPELFLTCSSGNPGAVYYCSNAHFRGDCIYRLPDDSCFAPPSAPQSIGPDKGGYCILFEDGECKGSIIRYDLKEPGINRVVCPGVMEWPESLPKVGSMRCHVDP